MKKNITALLASLLFVLLLGLWGCGSDDDPADPQEEACSISVTNPMAGDSFRPGDEDHETMNIRWTSEGDATLVKLELLKAGTLVDVIHPSVANSGFYRWTASNMGAANGSDFAIRVSAQGEEGCLGVSGLFTLTNTVGCELGFTTEFPQGLIAGDVFNLTWTSVNTTGQVDIQLRKQDQSLGFIAVGIENVGSFEWTVDSLHNGSYDFYSLRVMDSDLSDCYDDSDDFAMVDEDVCFIDVANPQANAVWEEGTNQDIMISYPPEVTSVDLRLYIGAVWLGNIASGVPVANFPFSWNVTDFENTQGTSLYRVQASNSDDEYCLGRSGLFTIVPQ